MNKNIRSYHVGIIGSALALTLMVGVFAVSNSGQMMSGGSLTSADAADAAATPVLSFGPNVVRNGDFSLDKQYWTLNGDESTDFLVQGTAKEANVYFNFLPDTFEGDNRSGNLLQSGIKLKPGKKYNMKFVGHSLNGEDINISLIENRTSGKYIALQSRLVDLAASKRTVSFNFTTPPSGITVTNAVLDIKMSFAQSSPSGTAYHFDNFMIRQIL